MFDHGIRWSSASLSIPYIGPTFDREVATARRSLPSMQTTLFALGLVLFLLGLVTGLLVPMLRNPRMGIAGHLHQHVVPRWGGDANFMPVIGQTKVLPQLLGQTRELLANAWH